jgi:hypothetical protein
LPPYRLGWGAETGSGVEECINILYKFIDLSQINSSDICIYLFKKWTEPTFVVDGEHPKATDFVKGVFDRDI